MRENIIEAQIDYSPRRDTWEVYDFDWIRMGAWGDIAKIKKLKVIVNDPNIVITEITYLHEAVTNVLYIIVDETHPLFNLNLFLTNIVHEAPNELVDEAHSELNDMLQAIIESYGINLINLNKR